jgi:hypothetical protein
MRNISDKACNNIVFVCKAHYYQCIINELGFNSTIGNHTYTPTAFSKDEILQNHASVLNTLNIPGHVDDYELPYLYWIPKLHKTPYKQRFIAGSKKCSTKPLSIFLIKMLTAVKERLRMYCATVYASGVNQMLIFKNSKELLENLKSPIFSQIYSIKTHDCTTLYTTIPHDKLKTRLFNMIDSCFFNKNGKRKYSYLVVNHSRTYFGIKDSDSMHKYSEVDIKEMGFLIDNIFVVFGNKIYQQTVGIPMGTNCAPLLADSFLYSYEA